MEIVITTHRPIWRSLAGAISILVCVTLRGEDLKTISGSAFKNFSVTALSEEEITLRHDGGMAKVALRDLPAEIRKRFTAEQLFLQLQAKEREIESLRSQLAGVNERSQGHAAPGPISPPNSSPVAPSASPKPRPAIDALPALNPNQPIDSADLAEHYKADRIAADRRYRNKTVLVRGRVEQLAPKLFLRVYTVMLESPERYVRVSCQFSYPDNFKSVIARENETRLVASLTGGREMSLMRLDEVITVKGTCLGMEGNAVILKGCERVR